MTKTVGQKNTRLQRAAEGENAAARFFPKITLELQAERFLINQLSPAVFSALREAVYEHILFNRDKLPNGLMGGCKY